MLRALEKQNGPFFFLSLHFLVVISRMPTSNDYLPSLLPSPSLLSPRCVAFLSGAHPLGSGTFPFPRSPLLPAFLPIYLGLGSPCLLQAPFGLGSGDRSAPLEALLSPLSLNHFLKLFIGRRPSWVTLHYCSFINYLRLILRQVFPPY